MKNRYELINFLNAHDDFRDNKNNKRLDSFDVVRLLNHYDELQHILIERDQKIADLEAKLAEKDAAHLAEMANAFNDFLELRQELYLKKTRLCSSRT